MMPNRAYPAALAAISKATSLDENEPRRWLKLGDVQMALDQPGGAYQAYMHAVDLAPDNVEGLQALAVLAVRARNFDEAKRYTDSLLVLSPNNPSGMLANGAIATHDRRYADADAIAKQMIAAAPDQPDGYALQVVNLREQNKLVEAAVILEQRSAVSPNDGNLLTQLMEIYQKRGDIGGVRRTALRLAPLYPDDPRYALESVRALQAAGRGQEAQQRLAGLARRYRYNVGAVVAIAQLWRQTLPADQALARVTALADQGSPATKAALGNVMLDMGAIPQVLALLAPLARGKLTTDTIDPHITFARALLLSGRRADATARVEEILDFDATNVGALLLRARLNLARKAYPAALNDAQLAASGDQTNQDAALLIGQVYAAMGNRALESRAFGAARDAFPDSFAVIRAWSDAALAQGDAAQAMSVVSDFALRHKRSGEAWSLYAKLCAASPDALCKIELRNHAKR